MLVVFFHFSCKNSECKPFDEYLQNINEFPDKNICIIYYRPSNTKYQAVLFEYEKKFYGFKKSSNGEWVHKKAIQDSTDSIVLANMESKFKKAAASLSKLEVETICFGSDYIEFSVKKKNLCLEALGIQNHKPSNKRIAVFCNNKSYLLYSNTRYYFVKDGWYCYFI